MVSALSPQGVLNGAIERFAARLPPPTNLLKPVDDELVQRLDQWREQALRYARVESSIDERLQALYAQLFVLRTVEDRDLDKSVPPVSSVVSNPDFIDRRAWRELLEIARVRVGSDLFEEDVTPEIPDHVMAGVIFDLYRPRGLPGGSATKYDFSWIEADVLGLAYEKYLASILQPAALASQFELFHSPQREVQRLSVRKETGAYYTPKFIRDYLATRCIDEFLKQAGAEGLPRIIDFACGSGSFLVSAVDQLLKHLKARDDSRSWARELVDAGHIVGIDVDPSAVRTARLHLWQRLCGEPHALPLPSLSKAVITADGLNRQTWGALDQPYDIVIGNPPFAATARLPNREQLEADFGTAGGRSDYSSLFVEQAVKVLRPGGHVGMVVPNRLYRNRHATLIREFLVEKCDLLTLVDFGSTLPFAASSYVGCIVARRRGSPAEARPDRVRVIEVQSLQPDYLAALLLEADASPTETKTEALRSYWARHPQSGAAWSLLSEPEQRALVLIEDLSVRLDTLADVPQGIRTGGNDLSFSRSTRMMALDSAR